MSLATLRRFAKAVAIYVLLVVPPVLGLLAILRSGADLRPPHSIGGDWQLSAAAPACSAFDLGTEPVTLAIAQSGLRAVGTLSGASLSLQIDGNTVTGEQDPSSECHVALAAQLEASELVGVLRWPGCTGCADRAFRASRTPRTGAAR